MATPFTVQVRQYGSSSAYFDLTPYIMFGGAKWSINPIDASDAGRGQDGKMHRAMVGEWRRLDISFIPLQQEIITQILRATDYEWLDVRYFDLQDGAMKTSKMYRGATLNATHEIQRGSMQLWSGMTLELIEE